MKALLAALVLGLSTLAAAQPASTLSPDGPQVEAAMAFARTYGVVRYFHPSDSLDRVDWDRFLVEGAERMASIGDAAAIGAQLEASYAPVVEGFKIVPKGAAAPAIEGEGPVVEWRHLGYGMEPLPRIQPFASWRTYHKPLFDGSVKGAYFQHEADAAAPREDPPVLRVAVGAGREALVPVSMPMSATKVGAAQDGRLKELGARLQSASPGGESFTRAQAWAAGIAAWNVARHFYPYWSVLSLDWEARLREWLAAQPPAQSRDAMRDALRRLVAPLDDGHGRIVDPEDTSPRTRLPISIRPLGDRFVVDASLVPARVQPGDVVAAVNGKPAREFFAGLMALQSGSPQFVRWRAAFDIVQGPSNTRVALRLERGGGIVNETLIYEGAKIVIAPRPDPIAEIRPGIWYVDLSRFRKAAFDAQLEKLKAARAIVFDLRGYPSSEAVEIVPYWITGVDSAQWMLVPRFDKPYAQFTTGWSTGWQRDRDAALEKPRKILVTDGRALSYAESLVGYFAGQKAGRIVGEATAGVNGNVVTASLPGGMKYAFTGMRVTRHDGTLYHREGFRPDVEVVPTIAGLRAGRDEVLERALEELSRP